MNMHDRWSWETRKLLRDGKGDITAKEEVSKSPFPIQVQLPVKGSVISRSVSNHCRVILIPFLQLQFLHSFTYQELAIPLCVKRIGLGLSLVVNLTPPSLELLKSSAFISLPAPTTAHTFVGHSKSSTEAPSS